MPGPRAKLRRRSPPVNLMPIIVIVAIIAVALFAFDYAALRWGQDTRDGFRYLNRYDVRHGSR